MRRRCIASCGGEHLTLPRAQGDHSRDDQVAANRHSVRGQCGDTVARMILIARTIAPAGAGNSPLPRKFGH
jgi:hypothetical protein